MKTVILRTLRLIAAFPLISALALGCLTSASADEISTDSSHHVSLTIYNQNFGLVKDIRSVHLKDGVNYLRFEDVASQIDPTSVSFQSLTAPSSVVVREQNYQYDLIDPNTILAKSIGKNIKLKQFLDNGRIEELSGTLLSAGGATINGASHVGTLYPGLVLKTVNGVVLNPAGQIELAELPPGLVSKPSLLWKLACNKAGLHRSEITYQTTGLNWSCDYVAITNQDNSKLDLVAWVTLDNRSGASYKNASLKLLAGEVHRVSPSPMQELGGPMAASPVSEHQFSEQAFAEYHLYTLQENTTLKDKETKQLTLFTADQIPSKKLYILDPSSHYGQRWIPPGPARSQKIQVKLELKNTTDNHLGMPMPKGKVRVYQRDHDGDLQFIGEDTIDHTAKMEKVRLYIGDAFDLVGERKQVTDQRLSSHLQRSSYEISLRNHKDAAVTITAIEHSWGQWRVVSSSHPYKMMDSHSFEFPVAVPANSEVKITYVMETKS